MHGKGLQGRGEKYSRKEAGKSEFCERDYAFAGASVVTNQVDGFRLRLYRAITRAPVRGTCPIRLCVLITSGDGGTDHRLLGLIPRYCTHKKGTSPQLKLYRPLPWLFFLPVISWCNWLTPLLLMTRHPSQRSAELVSVRRMPVLDPWNVSMMLQLAPREWQEYSLHAHIQGTLFVNRHYGEKWRCC